MNKILRTVSILLVFCMSSFALAAQGFHVYVDGQQAEGQCITVTATKCTISWLDPGYDALYEIHMIDDDGRMIQRYSDVSSTAFTMDLSAMQEDDTCEIRIGAYPVDGGKGEWVGTKVRFASKTELPPYDTAARPDSIQTPYILFLNTVHVRTDAGKDYASLGKVSENEVMTWLGDVHNDSHGLPWYNFKHGKNVAWVSSQYSMLWDGVSATDNASLCGDELHAGEKNAVKQFVKATPDTELVMRSAPGYHSVVYFTLSAADDINICEYEIRDGEKWALCEVYRQGKCYRAYTELNRVAAYGEIPCVGQYPVGKTIFTRAKANVYTSAYDNGVVNGKVGRGERIRLLGFENGSAFIEFYNISEDGWCRGYVPYDAVL